MISAPFSDVGHDKTGNSMGRWYRACGSQALIETHKRAYDIFRMSSVAQIPDFGFAKSNRNQHQAIYEAAIARDPSRCAQAIHDHLATHAVTIKTQMMTQPNGD